MKHLKPKTKLAKPQLTLFLAIFAAVGGVVLYLSFASPNPNLPGDLNGDNKVDGADLSFLAANFKTNSAAADINGDGIVDIGDLSVLLSNYGKSSSSVSAVDATATSHTVDGQLNESDWNLSSSLTKSTVGTNNNTSTFGVMWDNTYLYLGAKILDSSLRNDSGTSCYNDDSVEFYIDPNNDGGTAYDSTDKQITQRWNDSGICGLQGSTPGVLHGWANITGGYTVEIAVPWSSLGVTPSSGMNLGIDICNNDDDDGGSAEIQTCWNAAGNDSQNPSAFGHMSLSGTPISPPPPPPPPPPPSNSWLAANSPFNTLIPSNPSVTFNYNSGPLAGIGGINLNSYTWGVAIFDQLTNLPTNNLTQVSWACGTNPCWKIDNVPIPPQLYTYETTQLSLQDGERHASVLYGDKIYNLYEMSQDASGWHFAAGGVLRYGGSGVWNNNLGPWVGRASGFADYDGTVRKAEVDAGVINHALTASWPKNHIAQSSISPAVTSDGSCTSNCAPMGSRLQLDPTLTTQDFLNMGFTSYWMPILVAMQKYGVYVADSSNAMALFAEDWNNSGRVVWPSKTAWDNNSSKLLTHFRIVQPPSAPVLDDRTIFGQPHQ